MNHREAAIALLAAKANPNVENAYGWTPMHCADEKGHKDVQDALRAAGAHEEAPKDGTRRLSQRREPEDEPEDELA